MPISLERPVGGQTGRYNTVYNPAAMPTNDYGAVQGQAPPSRGLPRSANVQSSVVRTGIYPPASFDFMAAYHS